MKPDKTTFALFFGNRGFFPASLIAEARETLPRVLKEMGHDSLILEADATRYGAVETPAEGAKYAEFLAKNKGKFGGVILCLPNFGDETGAVAALKQAGVPIFVQAYPDENDKMSPELRRDSFCGKMSIMDVFYQYNVPFTIRKPHVVGLKTPAFEDNVAYFDSLCRVVNGLKSMTVGAIGARTTPFKTVRADEVALQRHGITVETVDLSSVISQVRAMAVTAAVKEKSEILSRVTNWQGVPDEAKENSAKFAVVMDQLVNDMQLDAVAVRCWTEMQSELGISPCVVMGVLNDRFIPSACEVDVANAVAMYALALGAAKPPALLDWNNNYGDDEDKCILFHCGPVPPSLMKGKGQISDHLILKNSIGEGKGYGCNVGAIAPMDFTFSSMLTENGKLKYYLGEGKFTDDPIPARYFGCAGVAHIDRLQDVLYYLGRTGHRHHVSIAPGKVMEPVREALVNYLGCEVAVPQESVCGCK
jgi:L-fucose isomerase-like protein